MTYSTWTETCNWGLSVFGVGACIFRDSPNMATYLCVLWIGIPSNCLIWQNEDHQWRAVWEQNILRENPRLPSSLVLCGVECFLMNETWCVTTRIPQNRLENALKTLRVARMRWGCQPVVRAVALTGAMFCVIKCAAGILRVKLLGWGINYQERDMQLVFYGTSELAGKYDKGEWYVTARLPLLVGERMMGKRTKLDLY